MTGRDADGRDLTRLTNTPGVWDSEPACSPDGSTIAFTRIYPAQHRRSEIWMLHPDGSDQRWISMEGFAARWSPDESRIAYSSEGSGDNRWEVYVVSADGANHRQVTHAPAPKTSINPVWRPDRGES